MVESKRIDLDGALAGYHILVDVDRLTIGILEDLESDRLTVVKRAVATLIVGGDLPHGCGNQGIRELKLAEFGAILTGLLGLLGGPPKKA